MEKSLFPTKSTPVTNEAGGFAYKLEDKEALAKLVTTGFLGDTVYIEAEKQLSQFKELMERVEPEFLAKAAIYATDTAFLKDMPVLALAYLSKHPDIFKRLFGRIITNGKQLRNFVRIIRSGAVGRKSLGTLPKKLIGEWLNTTSEAGYLNALVGNDPTLADVIKLSRPKPVTDKRNALFTYAMKKPTPLDLLPQSLVQFHEWKYLLPEERETLELPGVPFMMLSGEVKGTKEWTKLMYKMTWSQLRQNLNTLQRNNVFDNYENVLYASGKIADEKEIAKSKVYPYQILTTATNFSGESKQLKDALNTALEVAIENVPKFEGKIAVCIDVSGSMNCPISGYRRSATTSATYVTAAALMAVTMKHKNEDIDLLGFNSQLHHLAIDDNMNIIESVQSLASMCSGGTNCSLPLEYFNDNNISYDTIIYISDNESWLDRHLPLYYFGRPPIPKLSALWEHYKTDINPEAKLICIDISPSVTSPTNSGKDRYNIGGFSDYIFTTISDIMNNKIESQVSRIESIEF